MAAKTYLLLAALAGAFARTTSSSSTASAETTLPFPLEFLPRGLSYVGSIINADSCETTVGIACATGSGNAESPRSCPIPSTLTVTQAGSIFAFSTHNAWYGLFETDTVKCTLDGTTAGVCTTKVSASAHRDTTAITTTHKLGKKALPLYQVPITAGVGKLSHSAPCTLSVNAAAPTGLSQVYKVVVVQGAAALLAGAFI